MNDDRLHRAIRDASGPTPDRSASARTADAAWARAAALRAARTPRLRLIRRGAWVAAAAVLLGAGFFALRGTEPAFAVEGDPVEVRRGDDWEICVSTVPVNTVVRIPEGSRLLRAAFCDGSVRATPGTILQFVPLARSDQRCRVEVRLGRAEVEGEELAAAADGSVFVERDPAVATFHVTVSLDSEGGVPRVDVGSGRARVRAPSLGGVLSLGPRESATLARSGRGGDTAMRLTKVLQYSSEVALRLQVEDASPGPKGSMFIVGRTDAPSLVEVPAGQVRQAVFEMNTLALLRSVVAVEATVPTRYVWEKGAERVDVLRRDDGSVRVEAAGRVREFPSLEAYRTADAAQAALFGDVLGK